MCANKLIDFFLIKNRWFWPTKIYCGHPQKFFVFFRPLKCIRSEFITTLDNFTGSGCEICQFFNKNVFSLFIPFFFSCFLLKFCDNLFEWISIKIFPFVKIFRSRELDFGSIEIFYLKFKIEANFWKPIKLNLPGITRHPKLFRFYQSCCRL